MKTELEEAAEKYNDDFQIKGGSKAPHIKNVHIMNHFIEGAKWQQERMYSEEEVLEIVSNCDGSISQVKNSLNKIKRSNMKELKRIKVLEDELALLKADLMKVEEKKEPVAICGILGFLVHPTELGKMTWEEAKKACASLGKGWRLPTRVELLLIYENKDVVGDSANSYYWSSTEYASVNAWYFTFDDGVADYYDKNSTFYVRAVKTI